VLSREDVLAAFKDHPEAEVRLGVFVVAIAMCVKAEMNSKN